MAARWGKACIVLSALGATVGSLLDSVHTHSGTTEYANPVFFRMAWWVPPEFALAALAIGLSRPLWERVLERRTAAPPAWSVTFGMVMFMLAYVLSGFLPFDWTTKSLVLVLIFGLVWTVCDRTALGVFLAGATALLGTSTEISLVRLDLFSYLHPNLSVVAGWLPWLYASAAIAVGNLGKRLVDADVPVPGRALVSEGTPTSPP